MKIKVKGLTVLIDEEDYERIISKNWNICRGYPRTREGNGHIYMHQFILGRKKGFVVDHINFNTLDNRKINLRFATAKQNLANRKKVSGKTSKYIGVCLASKGPKRKKKWRALIKGKLIGYFATQKEAAMAFDAKASEEYGEFASLNFKKG